MSMQHRLNCASFASIKRLWELSRALYIVISAHSATFYGCECTLMESMGLPCKRLFKTRLQKMKNLF